MSIAEKLTTIAENEEKVFLAGHSEGRNLGYTLGYPDGHHDGYAVGEQDGYAKGKQANYDVFWDSFQQNGKRTAYAYGFRYWNGECFRPKYDIVPTGNTATLFGEVKGIKNLPERLKECGVTLDLSNVTDFSSGFLESDFEDVGELDLSSANAINFCFQLSKVKTIQKLKLKEIPGNTSPYGSAFNKCSKLETLIVEGGISKKGFNVSDCTKLTHESLMSIINCLSDNSGTSTTLTITLGEVNLAKLTDEEKAIATQKGWTLA